MSGPPPVLVPPTVAVLAPFVDAGICSALDVHAMASFVRAAGHVDGDVIVAGALALAAARRGDSCVTLADPFVGLDAEAAAGVLDRVADARLAADEQPLAALPAAVGAELPDADAWAGALAASDLVAVADAPGVELRADHPFVLWSGLLYTQRQWNEECVVASALRRIAADALPDNGSDDGGEALFAAAGLNAQQRRAAESLRQRRLTVVLGGPGTGKTYTAGVAIAALAAADRDLRIGLAAPTGKAAARLRQSITSAVAALRTAGVLDHQVAAGLEALPAVTIHRLLGPRPDHRTRFKHHRDDPLPYDVVIVDETSMVALPLMARLLEALPSAGRLMLLGDPYQLESVELGTVLADVDRAAAVAPLRDAVVRLDVVLRTAEAPTLSSLADAIRAGDPDAVVAALRGGDQSVTWVELDDATPASQSDVATTAVLDAVGGAFDVVATGSDDGALAALETARVLCAHRRGPFGVSGWNQVVTDHQAISLAPGQRRTGGTPVLVGRNEPALGLVNGDIGVSRRRGRVNEVLFAGRRPIARAQLDDAQLAWAITVHKAQGSEHQTVAFIHPPADSPLARRELLYTAVTRAKQRLVVVASEAALRVAVATPSRRRSGLAALLRGDGQG